MTGEQVITTIFEAIDKTTGVTKRIEKTMKNYGSSVQEVTNTSEELNGQINELSSSTKTTSGLIARFDMRLLSIGFGMQMITRNFELFGRAAVETYMSAVGLTTEFAKQIFGLSAAWEYFKFMFVETLLAPVLEPLIPIIIELISFFWDWAETNPELMKIIGTVLLLTYAVAAILGPIAFLLLAWNALSSMVTGTALLGSATGTLALIIGFAQKAAFQAGLAFWYWISGSAAGFGSLGILAAELGSGLVELGVLAGILAVIFAAVIGAVAEGLKTLPTTMDDIGKAMTELMEGRLNNALIYFLAAITNTIFSVVGGVIAGVGALVVGVATIIVDAVGIILGGITNLIVDFLNLVDKAIGGTGDKWKKVEFTPIPIGQTMTDFWDLSTGLTENFTKAGHDGFLKMFGLYKDAGVDAANKVLNSQQNALTTYTNAGVNATNTVMNAQKSALKINSASIESLAGVTTRNAAVPTGAVGLTFATTGMEDQSKAMADLQTQYGSITDWNKNYQTQVANSQATIQANTLAMQERMATMQGESGDIATNVTAYNSYLNSLKSASTEQQNNTQGVLQGLIPSLQNEGLERGNVTKAVNVYISTLSDQLPPALEANKKLMEGQTLTLEDQTTVYDALNSSILGTVKAYGALVGTTTRPAGKNELVVNAPGMDQTVNSMANMQTQYSGLTFLDKAYQTQLNNSQASIQASITSSQTKASVLQNENDSVTTNLSSYNVYLDSLRATSDAQQKSTQTMTEILIPAINSERTGRENVNKAINVYISTLSERLPPAIATSRTLMDGETLSIQNQSVAFSSLSSSIMGAVNAYRALAAAQAARTITTLATATPLPTLQAGGTITNAGAAYLHAGETVTPSGGGGGGIGPITVSVETGPISSDVDVDELAKRVSETLVDQIKRYATTSR